MAGEIIFILYFVRSFRVFCSVYNSLLRWLCFWFWLCWLWVFHWFVHLLRCSWEFHFINLLERHSIMLLEFVSFWLMTVSANFIILIEKYSTIDRQCCLQENGTIDATIMPCDPFHRHPLDCNCHVHDDVACLGTRNLGKSSCSTWWETGRTSHAELVAQFLLFLHIRAITISISLPCSCFFHLLLKTKGYRALLDNPLQFSLHVG